MYFSTSRVIKNAALSILAASSFMCLTASAQNNSVDNSVLSIERNKADNSPKHIAFTPQAGWKAGQAQEIFKKYLGIDGVNTTMVQKYSTTTKAKVTVDRYTQYYKGIKVEYGGYSLTIKNGQVQVMAGNYYAMGADVPVAPAITEGIAFGYALDFVHAKKYMWQDAKAEAFIKKRFNNSDTSYLPHGNLEWIEDYGSGANDHHLHLAYSFDIYAKTPVSRQLVFVDAQTGKVLYSNSIIKHTAATGHTLYSGSVTIQTANTGSSYMLFDSTRGTGVYTINAGNGTDMSAYTDFTTTGTSWPALTPDSQAIDAQWGAEMVYDYWSTQQGRLSYDNADGMLVQFVHWDTSFNNAYWDGYEMVYGDGTGCGDGGFTPLTSLDVTAHEIGHGVCQYTAALVYSGESGGMNEGFSDCWGATIENWANPHETDGVAKQTWKIGEEIGCGNPLRSMDSPNLQYQPALYEGLYWYPVSSACLTYDTLDYCGVHTNSGVLNHWYYLVTMGGIGTNEIGNSYNVNGLGWTDAPAILYATELALASNATYADCRVSTIDAATAAFGACSPQVQSVTNAWYAVGVGDAFVPCAPQIGFTATTLDVSENAVTTSCPATKTINIGLQASGPSITGGSPVATIVVGHGTAVAGVDYSITTPSVTFTPGDVSVHNAVITLYDNGAVGDNKDLAIGITIAAAGTGATVTPTADSMFINIYNDDSIPSSTAPVATALAAAHTWDVRSGTEVYFYNTTDGKLIAGLKNETADLGCVSATVSGSGNGLTPTAFSSLNRSRKEITITPTTGAATTAYDATIYLTSTELGSATASSLYLLKTDAATDADVTAANTVIVTPTLVTGTGYVGFRGHFTGFSRFFLVDGSSLCTPPVAAITAGGTTTFCSGSSVTLSATTGTSYTYQWKSGTTDIPGATNATYTATTGSSYSVVISQLGCTATSAATVVTVDSVYAAPISGGSSVCEGQTLSLTDAVTGGTWLSTNLPVATVSASGVVTGVSAGTATISYTVTNTCGSASQTKVVTVHASPVVAAISAPATLCTGTSATFTDATPGGVWSGGSTTTAVVSTTGSVAAIGEGTAIIHYTVTNSSGCAAVASVTVTIAASPSAIITPVGSTTFCTDGSVVLSTTGGASYQWRKEGVNIPGATDASYTADTTGNFTVRVTGSDGCSTLSGVTATLEDASFTLIPAVSINALPGTVICTGSEAVSFTAVPVNGGSAPTYKWYVNGSLTASGSAYSYTPADGDVVSAVMTSNAACVSPDTATSSVAITIGVSVTPSVSISVSPNDSICAGTATTFTALPVFGGTAPSYIWKKNGIPVGTGDTYTYTPAAGDIITCVMASNMPCRLVDSATSNIIHMVVTPVTDNTITITATATSIVVGQAVTFTAHAPHAGSSPVYQWYIDGVPVPGATSFGYVTDTLHNGQVVTCDVTSSNPCSSPATNLSSGITILVTTAVHEAIRPNSFTLAPNPNKGTFVIKGSIASADNSISLKITDVLGQVIYTSTIAVHNGSVNEQIDLAGTIANGMYLVNIASSTGSVVYRVVIDK